MKVNEIIKEVAPANPNAAFKVTRQNPDGSIELADPAGTKINIPQEKQAELKQDPANPNQLTLDPNALAKAGTTDATSGPPIGSTVNISSTIPGQITPTSTAPSETMGSVSENMQEISPKLARYFLRKIDAGIEVTDLVNDSAELHTMYNDVALMHHLHPDDDFEKIEKIIINNLNDIADSDYEDDFYDADESDVEQSDDYEFESIKRLAGL